MKETKTTKKTTKKVVAKKETTKKETQLEKKLVLNQEKEIQKLCCICNANCF